MRLSFAILAAFAPLFATALAVPAHAQDAAAGEQSFKKICSACHNPTVEGPRKLGPSLFKVIGRKAGTLDGYKYSNAKRDPDLVWTPEKLDPYLTNPREFMPGTTMAYTGLKNPTERANVIAYLQTLK
jgi:cytochrome c